MTRPLAFHFVALGVGLAAGRGNATLSQQLRLAEAALCATAGEQERAAARMFLQAAGSGHAAAAGEVLVDWVQRQVSLPVPPEYDWQRRRDLA